MARRPNSRMATSRAYASVRYWRTCGKSVTGLPYRIRFDGVGDGLVQRVLADAHRGEAQVELAHVHGVQRGVEGGLAGVQHVGLGDRVLVQLELADVRLRVHHVLDQPVALVAAVGGEEHVALRALHVGAAAEHRHHARLVAVADVVLAAGRGEAAVPGRREHHVGGVDVGAVLALGQAEGEDRALVQQPRRALPGGGVLALPDRAEAQDRDLPRVPVARARRRR